MISYTSFFICITGFSIVISSSIFAIDSLFSTYSEVFLDFYGVWCLTVTGDEL